MARHPLPAKFYNKKTDPEVLASLESIRRNLRHISLVKHGLTMHLNRFEVILVMMEYGAPEDFFIDADHIEWLIDAIRDTQEEFFRDVMEGVIPYYEMANLSDDVNTINNKVRWLRRDYRWLEQGSFSTGTLPFACQALSAAMNRCFCAHEEDADLINENLIILVATALNTGLRKWMYSRPYFIHQGYGEKMDLVKRDYYAIKRYWNHCYDNDLTKKGAVQAVINLVNCTFDRPSKLLQEIIEEDYDLGAMEKLPYSTVEEKARLASIASKYAGGTQKICNGEVVRGDEGISDIKKEKDIGLGGVRKIGIITRGPLKGCLRGKGYNNDETGSETEDSQEFDLDK